MIQVSQEPQGQEGPVADISMGTTAECVHPAWERVLMCLRVPAGDDEEMGRTCSAKARGLLQFETSRCRDPWFGTLPADLGRAQNGPSAGAEINQNDVRRLDV